MKGPNAGDIYGVTCAHVARSGDPVTDAHSMHLGTCVAHSALVQLPSGASTDDPANLWAAMFFGDDGARGFAIRASGVHTWAEREKGHSLTV